MIAFGVVLVILGIIGRLFASVTHITDTTVKAMGWIALNHIVSVASWIALVIGGGALLLGIGGA